MANKGSTANPIPQIWEQRWAALDQTLARLEERCSQLPDSTPTAPTQKQNLIALVSGLREFGGKQFKFFYEGFGLDPNPGYKLIRDDEFPPEHVLSTVLEQISFDIEALERAITQRERDCGQQAQGKQDTPETQKMHRRLALADELARQALDLARPLLDGKEIAVITYFEKVLQVRVVPYAPAALIGIPFTSLQVTHDLLAIPHEVGHFVYWNGTTGSGKDGGPLRKVLKEKMPTPPAPPEPGTPEPAKQTPGDFGRAWLEEIFADVYGAFVGGSVMALDFQDLQLIESRDGFKEDDGKHPVPAIRPFIYTKALDCKYGSQFGEKLDERWRTKLQARIKADDSDNFKRGTKDAILFRRKTGEEIDPTEAVARAKEIVEIIYQNVPILAQGGNWPRSNQLDDQNLPSPITEADVNDWFAQVEASIEETDPKESRPQISSVSWDDWVMREEFFGHDESGNPLKRPQPGTEVLMGSHKYDLTHEKQPKVAWARVWLAARWTSGGPNKPWA